MRLVRVLHDDGRVLEARSANPLMAAAGALVGAQHVVAGGPWTVEGDGMLTRFSTADFWPGDQTFDVEDMVTPAA